MSMLSKPSSPVFVADGDVPWTDLGGGVSRKVLCHDPGVMLVRVRFETGAVGPPHHHPHVQCTLVASGRFEVRIGDAVQVLSAGDCFRTPPDVVHSVVALEAGELIDSFTPRRDEFI